MHTKEILKTFEHYLGETDLRIDYLERFLGGMSNFTYHVKIKGVDYVIRIANQDGKVFVNYAGEKLHLLLLEDLNITSKTLYYDLETGNKISEYIPGHNLVALIEEEDYKAIAKLLHQLHASPIEGIKYNKVERLNKYEDILNHPLTPLFYELKTFWLHELNTTYNDVSNVFTHGDAQRSNIIKGETRYYLLDFEFAGINDPYYDLASIGNIDFANALTLLDYYLGRQATPLEKRRVMFNRLYQVLQWHLVATHKEDTGLSQKVHIDFKIYAKRYLNFARELMEQIKKIEL